MVVDHGRRYLFLTLLLEWPYVTWCLRKCDRWFVKSIWGSLAVQSASYLVLFGWYWMARATSLYTDVAVVQLSEISLPERVVIYYIAENDRDVYALDLRRGQTKRICELKSSDRFDWLSLQESQTDAGGIDGNQAGGPGDCSPAPSRRLRCLRKGVQ